MDAAATGKPNGPRDETMVEVTTDVDRYYRKNDDDTEAILVPANTTTKVPKWVADAWAATTLPEGAVSATTETDDDDDDEQPTPPNAAAARGAGSGEGVPKRKSGGGGGSL